MDCWSRIITLLICHTILFNHLHAVTLTNSSISCWIYLHAHIWVSLHLRHPHPLRHLLSLLLRYAPHNEGDREITTNKMASLLLISIIVLNFGMPLCNIPQLQFSNRITTFISIIGVCGSILTISFGTQFWHYLLIYGIVFGIFIGFGYLAPIKNCYEHIPHLKGNYFIIKV